MDEAIAQAKERAEARCAGCQMDKRLNFGKLQLPPRQRYPDHTCHGDLAAVRDVALAAFNAGAVAAFPEPLERRHACVESDIAVRVGKKKAEIERLLPEGSEGGQE